MINTAPNVVRGGIYTSQQTTKILGIAPSTLQRHTKQGHIKFGINSINNRREYYADDITKYWKKQHSKLH